MMSGTGAAGQHRPLRRLAAALVGSLLCGGAVADDAGERAWRLGVHPYISATQLLERLQPLADYLTETTGDRFEVRVANSYEAHIHAVAEGQVDLAYMGPSSYGRLWLEHGRHEVLARQEVQGRDVFHGILAVRDDSDLEALPEVEGRTVAFVSDDSTMGYRMPRQMLAEAGVEPGDTDSWSFLGNHFNVASAVLLGDVEVGAMREEVFRRFRSRGVRALARTEPVPQHPWVVRQGVAAERVERWREALLDLSDHPQGEAVLEALGPEVTGLVPASAEDYRPLRELVESAP
ncbi:phosphate/phosphite/phosphonate ABC transporter substrate-binding protein [Thiohalospira sp.]|uniref:phosphate/phosphite/phosphonate ABC transporter substrate-binding protein n=1 Tax=Thiohalospira sp. TaxID=3080549 RepID=UPI0039817825